MFYFFLAVEQKKASTYVNILLEHELYDTFTSPWEILYENTPMSIRDDTASTEVHFAVLRGDLSRIFIAEAEETSPVSLVYSSRPDSEICSELVSTAVFNMDSFCCCGFCLLFYYFGDLETVEFIQRKEGKPTGRGFGRV